MKKKITFTGSENTPESLFDFKNNKLICTLPEHQDELKYVEPISETESKLHVFNIYELEKEGIVTIEEITE